MKESWISDSLLSQMAPPQNLDYNIINVFLEDKVRDCWTGSHSPRTEQHINLSGTCLVCDISKNNYPQMQQIPVN